MNNVKSIAISLLAFAVCLFLATGCEEVLEKDISRERVQLLAPSDNVITADTAQQFSWEYISSPADYQLQVVSPRFDSIAALVMDTITRYDLVKLNLKKGKQYQWRVRAFNFSYTSAYSQPWTLTIQ